MTFSEKGESAKLQQHLTLLKEEFVKLQSHCSDLERKYAIACASGGDINENSFVSKLVSTVAGLFSQELYSDVKIKLSDRSIPAHRLVLSARGDKWGSLSDQKELDWSKWAPNVALAALKWLYTDQADLTHGDTFTLDLMCMANDFKLEGLVSKCEKALMASVNVKNCVRFYIRADEINANALKEHCSGLISAHWDDFTSDDFAGMSARLLYSMFKSKTGFPLHAAVRLDREDVVFLYLVENTADLPTRLNTADSRGELALELALSSGRSALATTLVEHGARPDARDARGLTPLLHAARRRDARAVAFLLERAAAPDAADPASGDTPLHLVAAHAADEAVAVAKLLLDAGANPNLKNHDGFTSVHTAVAAASDGVLTLLLADDARVPADLDARTAEGHPPLWFALQGDATEKELCGSSAPASRLLAAGAAPNPAYPQAAAGDRLLHRLARQGCEEAALFVASKASIADLAVANDKGETALHVACAQGLARLVARLLERGVPANAQTVLPPAASPPTRPVSPPSPPTPPTPSTARASAPGTPSAPGCPFDSDDDTVEADDEADDEDDDDSPEDQKSLADQEPAAPVVPVVPAGLVAGGETALHVAVRCRQEGAVRELVAFAKLRRDAASAQEDGAGGAVELDARDAAGNTPLTLALGSAQYHLVPLLLEGGADVNARDARGLSLLQRALRAGDAEAALFLLENGADPHATTPPPRPATPLQLAIRARLPASVAEALCRRGADLSAGESDAGADPPLWEALVHGQTDVAAVLVRHGADPDCWGPAPPPAPEGCFLTLLHRALLRRDEALAKFLIRSGCDVNGARRGESSGSAPLHMCCEWGLEEAARTLVEHGADVNARDAHGRSPLHVAVRAQQAQLLALLLAQPALDATLRDRQGLSPFATALAVRDPRAAQAILDRAPAAARQVDAQGRNFLHTALARRDIESVLFLLAVQMDVNARVQDAEQASPLALAAASGDETVVRSLLLAGARVGDADARGRTALHAAAARGHAAVVSALLQNGADADARDAEGQTALHAAARAAQLGAARALLTESHADAEAADMRGRTPLHALALARDHGPAAAVAELFFECMPKYQLDKADLEGNTALLLAYMKGNGNLCRTLVMAGACLGCMNKDGITIFNYQVATKQLLYRLLDHLSQEPPWAEGDICLECGTKFGLTMRKHHCRHCGRILCSRCSGRDVPILKFNLNKPVRVCSVCFDVLQIGST